MIAKVAAACFSVKTQTIILSSLQAAPPSDDPSRLLTHKKVSVRKGYDNAVTDREPVKS